MSATKCPECGAIPCLCVEMPPTLIEMPEAMAAKLVDMMFSRLQEPHDGVGYIEYGDEAELADWVDNEDCDQGDE